MRVRTDNPHALPPRMYERHNKKTVVWFYKYLNGSPRVLASAPVGDEQAIIEAREKAIQLALKVASDKVRSPGVKYPAPPKPRKRPEFVRPVEKKDLSKAPMWAWNLYRKAKADARRRGIEWKISPNEFAWLVSVTDGRCQVTGMELVIPTAKKRGPFGPSLDRIDSRKPYEIGNVRLVCVAVNIAMNAWGLDVFLRVAEAAVLHQKQITYSKDSDLWNTNRSNEKDGQCLLTH